MILTSHGPVLAHNCCQAIARDVMADAMVALEAAGFPPLFTVHDEVISSVRGEEDKAAVIEIMCRTPKWAAGLPLKASGEVGERYGK
jgi:DNA polymerase bacteriophage-type